MDAAISAVETKPAQWQLWVGRVLSALPILAMVGSAGMKLSHQAGFVTKWTGELGYPESTLTGVGLLELTCALLFAIPRTKILGAVLITGYFGGAIASHLRIGEPFVLPLLIPIFAWVGLFLRDPKVRALSPV